MNYPFKINWKYALGEILIVIIGITIAFSLNNWAENAGDWSLRKEYLESLIADLSNEVQQLEGDQAEFQQKVNTIQSIFPHLGGKKEGRDTLLQKIFSLAEIVYFQPNDVTYRTLVNSGDPRLFSDFELKKALETHYSGQNQIQQDYERQNKIHEKYLADFLIYRLDYEQIRQGNYDFADDRMLRNIIQSLYGSYRIAMDAADGWTARSQQLIERLSRELDRY